MRRPRSNDKGAQQRSLEGVGIEKYQLLVDLKVLVPCKSLLSINGRLTLPQLKALALLLSVLVALTWFFVNVVTVFHFQPLAKVKESHHHGCLKRARTTSCCWLLDAGRRCWPDTA